MLVYLLRMGSGMLMHWHWDWSQWGEWEWEYTLQNYWESIIITDIIHKTQQDSEIFGACWVYRSLNQKLIVTVAIMRQESGTASNGHPLLPVFCSALLGRSFVAPGEVADFSTLGFLAVGFVLNIFARKLSPCLRDMSKNPKEIGAFGCLRQYLR